MLLFDTSAVIGLVERANGDTRRLIVESRQRPFVSLVTLAELHVGVRAASSDHSRQLRLRTLQRATSFRLVSVDEQTFDAYADARLANLRGNDAWIAAAARKVGGTLVTEDEVMAERAQAIVDVILVRSDAPQ